MTSLVLASGSATRALLLRGAGIEFEIDVPSIDESELVASYRASGYPAEKAAESLAEMKAQRISARAPESLVLGCDQMLDCDGVWFSKPADRQEARDQLKSLRGRSHRLISSAVLVRNRSRLWHHTSQAVLTMRHFSDTFLEHYLDRTGAQVLKSVGAYQLEGPGIQLFSRIEGDYFTILGLPLLPVVDILREQGVLAS